MLRTSRSGFGPGDHFLRGARRDQSFQFSLAPEKLWQAINPWSLYNQGAQLGLVNVNLGQTPHPEIEQKLLDEVGSYGRQLGRIGDALEVLDRPCQTRRPQPVRGRRVAILKGQLAEIRKLKQRERSGEDAGS